MVVLQHGRKAGRIPEVDYSKGIVQTYGKIAEPNLHKRAVRGYNAAKERFDNDS
jgi:hypothetical protein